MTVHIEGMGVLGSMVARRLDEAGVPFTWHDIDAEHSAWPVSTGCVFRTGVERDLDGWRAWLGHFDDPHLAPHLELCDYVFNHKAPPHQGKDGIRTDLGALRVLDKPGIQVNVPSLVTATRAAFTGERRPEAPPMFDPYVIAHGYSSRLARYMWGWAARVELDLAPALASALEYERPIVYLRRGRFVMAYAYPIPGTPHYWAGSSLISQREAKPLEVLPKLERWKALIDELSGGMVRCREVASVEQGWRPVPRKGDPLDVERMGNVLRVPPLWHNGVRWAPMVADEVLANVYRLRAGVAA